MDNNSGCIIIFIWGGGGNRFESRRQMINFSFIKISPSNHLEEYCLSQIPRFIKFRLLQTFDCEMYVSFECYERKHGMFTRLAHSSEFILV